MLRLQAQRLLTRHCGCGALTRGMGMTPKKKKNKKADADGPIDMSKQAAEARANTKIAQLYVDMRRSTDIKKQDSIRDLTADEKAENDRIHAEYTRQCHYEKQEHRDFGQTRVILQKEAIKYLPTQELRDFCALPDDDATFDGKRHFCAPFPPSEGYNTIEQMEINRRLHLLCMQAYKPWMAGSLRFDRKPKAPAKGAQKVVRRERRKRRLAAASKS